MLLIPKTPTTTPIPPPPQQHSPKSVSLHRHEAACRLPIHILPPHGRRVLCLSELPETYFSVFDEFLLALENISSSSSCAHCAVDRVHIDGDFFHRLPAVHQERLLLEIGRFPNLKHVYMGHCTVHAADLALVLKMAFALESLHLVHVTLTGDELAWRELESGLWYHESLRSVVWRDFTCNDSSSTMTLDGMVSAISSIPNLEEFEIDSQREIGLSVSSLFQLFRGHNFLAKIHLSHVCLNHPIPEDLIASCNFHSVVAPLQRVSLKHCGLNDRTALKIVRLLSSVPSLEVLDLSSNRNITKDGILQVEAALRTSSCRHMVDVVIHPVNHYANHNHNHNNDMTVNQNGRGEKYHPFFNWSATAA